VSSDGYEDCFVVARNRRSAARVELDMNGFDPDDVEAERIGIVPREVERTTSGPTRMCGRGLGTSTAKSCLLG
jgi:hypothetical protein